MKRIWARVLAWTAVFLLAAGVLSFPAMADLIDTSDNETIRQSSIPRGKIGRNMNVTLEIWNNSGSDWDDIKVVIDNPGNYMAKPSEQGLEYIFPFEKTAEKRLGGTLKSGSHRSVSIPVKVRADLTEGYYYVTVEVRASNDYFMESDEINVYLSMPKAGDEDEEPEKQITFVLGEGQSTPYGVYPEVMNYTINMRNAGLNDALDVTVEMVLDKDSEKFPFDINDGNYDRTFERVAAGETVQLPYSMAIRSDTYSDYYPIGFNITYRDTSTGNLLTEENTFWVKIKNKEKEDKSSSEWNEHNNTTARIVVDGFHTIPEEVIAGEPFQLFLSMKNASSNIAASNIMFTLESEAASASGGSGSSGGGGSVFTTQSGSNSSVVNALAPGEVTELQFAMQSIAGIDQRSYYLNIKVKYDSPDYKNAETTVRIDIPVHQIPRLNIGNIEVMPDSIGVGSESNVMFPINNTGKVILYNVMVNFEADSIDPAETYVGNIQPGQPGNVDVMLNGVAPTADDGTVKITITYEDEYGELQEPVEKELTLFVNAPEEDFGEDMMAGDFQDVPAEPAFLQKYLKFIVAAVVLVAAVTAFSLLRYRKKKKKEKESAEELEDEIS